MRHPFAEGNAIEWARSVHHRTGFRRTQSVADVYGKMLTAGVDFAAAFDERDMLCGLISFRMLSSTLSAKYGQALFAEKPLGKTSVPRMIFGPVAKEIADVLVPLIIPLDQTVVVTPSVRFLRRAKTAGAAPLGAQPG